MFRTRTHSRVFGATKVNTQSPVPLNIPVQDAFRALGIGRTLFYSEVAAGRIRIIKIGTRSLVPVAELHRYNADRIAESEQAA